MRSSKWFAPILPYLAVCAGLFWFKSAWLALAGFHAAILFVLVFARPNIPPGVLFKGRHIEWVVAGAVLCASGGIILYFLHPFLGMAEDLSLQLDGLGLNRSTWPLFIAYFSLVNPFLEEYFWRGYLGSDTKGLYFGDLVYAGYHGLVLVGKLHPLMIFFALVCITFVGWFWRQASRAQGGLLAAVVGHAAADLSILVAVYLITRS